MDGLKSEERLGGHFRRQRSVAGILFVSFLIISSGVVFYSQSFFRNLNRSETQQQDEAQFSDVMKRLDIQSTQVLQNPQVKEALRVLQRETCDRNSMRVLADLLRRGSFRREAANAYVRFAEGCPHASYGWRIAAGIYLDELADFKRAIDAAGSAVAAEPYVALNYFLRGMARFRSDDFPNAIDDLSTFIALTSDRTKLNQTAFVKLSESYEKVGDLCNAMFPLYQWVSLNPSKNDTPQIRQMLSAIRMKGSCASSQKKTEDVFWRQNDVMRIQAKINGVAGMFILDTGASYLTLKKSFAAKAEVKIHQNSKVAVNSPTGIVTAARGIASKVELIRISAVNVPILVQEESGGIYADVDGLLGISFLSNFDVSFEGNSVKISTRAP